MDHYYYRNHIFDIGIQSYLREQFLQATWAMAELVIFKVVYIFKGILFLSTPYDNDYY